MKDKTLYIYDPRKNTGCPKERCAFNGLQFGCTLTTRRECADVNEDGEPLRWAASLFDQEPIDGEPKEGKNDSQL